jgi:hypothetical protein
MITPTDFYLVYAKFTTLPGQPDALVHDGLLTRDEAIEAINGHFGRHYMASTQTLAVLRVQSDVPVQNVTEEIIAEVYPRTEEDDEADRVDTWLDDWKEAAV